MAKLKGRGLKDRAQELRDADQGRDKAFAAADAGRQSVVGPELREDVSDEAEIRRAKEKSERRSMSQDKVGQVLGAGFYLSARTLPWLRRPAPGGGEPLPMYFSQYFPPDSNPDLEAPVAVDRFQSMADFERAAAEIELKRRLCREQGVRYGVLHPELSIVDLAIELEAQ